MGSVAVSGWGLTTPSQTNLHIPNFDELISKRFEFKNFTIARGMGRSYGDAAQISGGDTISTEKLDTYNFDFETGKLIAQSGVTIAKLIKDLAPKGWFVPVTPGTRYVTVGGAVASDIHGKNHHTSGSFSDHITRIEILTPVGLISCSREENQDLFNATCGGMGLTGLILTVELTMKKIESTQITVDTKKVSNIDQLLDLMPQNDSEYPYTVAWVDTLSKGKNLGRSILSSGRHSQKFTENDGKNWSYKDRQFVTFPRGNKFNLINKFTAKTFNEMWYQKAPKNKTEQLQSIGKFFHPLDGAKNWNHVYGKHGFIQYQFVVPDDQTDFIKLTLEIFSKMQIPNFLTVLKRFGEQNHGLLSFPKKGWTLAVDFPTKFSGLPKLLNDLDRQLLDAGGRIYLTKDSRSNPEIIEQMYPNFEKFRKIKSIYDPEQVIKSDLSLRLNL